MCGISSLSKSAGGPSALEVSYLKQLLAAGEPLTVFYSEGTSTLYDNIVAIDVGCGSDEGNIVVQADDVYTLVELDEVSHIAADFNFTATPVC